MQEDRARVVSSQLLSDLIRAGAPQALLSEAERVRADEERHVRICAHVIQGFGGEARDPRTQVPRLPDWAIIDTSTPPDAYAPGKIAAAGFFNEDWKLK